MVKTATILKTDKMTMRFGGVTAVNGLNLDVREHQIVALIGPNGAGKTTAFNMITGVYTHPTDGDVIYTNPGQRIRRLPVKSIVKLLN